MVPAGRNRPGQAARPEARTLPALADRRAGKQAAGIRPEDRRPAVLAQAQAVRNLPERAEAESHSADRTAERRSRRAPA